LLLRESNLIITTLTFQKSPPNLFPFFIHYFTPSFIPLTLIFSNLLFINFLYLITNPQLFQLAYLVQPLIRIEQEICILPSTSLECCKYLSLPQLEQIFSFWIMGVNWWSSTHQFLTITISMQIYFEQISLPSWMPSLVSMHLIDWVYAFIPVQSNLSFVFIVRIQRCHSSLSEHHPSKDLYKS